MNRTNYYLVVVSATLIAILIGILLIPNREETSLMLFYDKQYEKAYADYTALYNHGDRSIRVVMPLVWLEVKQARIDRAIELMETFLHEHPHVPGGRQYLGTLFQDASLYKKYVNNLNHIPSIEALREQERFYRNMTDLPKRVETLNLVSEKGQTTHEEYLTLAYLYAMKGEHDKAEHTIDQVLQTFDREALSPDAINLAINIFIDNQKKQRAFLLAKDYLAIYPNLDALDGIEKILINADMFQEGLVLLEDLPEWARRSPKVLDLRITLLLGKKEIYLAYELMRQHFAIGDLPKGQWENLFDLAIEYRDFSLLENILTVSPLDLFEESDLLRIVPFPRLNRLMQSKRAEGYQALAIALALTDPTLSWEENRFLHANYSIDEIEDPQKLTLAKLYHQRRYRDLTRRVLEKVEALSDSDPFIVTKLYQETGLLERALTLVDEEGQHNLWFLLSIAAGNEEALKNPSSDRKILEGGFWIAAGIKEVSFAAVIAKLLNNQFPSDESRRILGEAYLLLDKYEKALPIFREMYRKGMDVSDSYLTVLSEVPGSDQEIFELAQQEIKKGSKGKWVRELVDLELYEEAISLVEKEELKDDLIADAYFEALANAKQEEMLSDAIAYVIPEESRLPRLKKFGKLFRDYGYSKIAEEIYQKAQMVEPSDPETLEALGIINYDKGNYCKARQYLTELLLQSEDPGYLPYYYYGLLCEKREGRPYFAYALQQIQEDPYVEAQILYQLNCYREAISRYREMIEEDPENMYYRSDLANIFIDLECYCQAATLLCSARPELNILLAKTRLLIERNLLCQALRLSNYLLARFPESGLAFASRADIEYKMGRWRRALSYLNGAQSVEPENELYCKQREAILLEHLPDITIGWEYRKTGETQKEHFIRLHFSSYIYPYTLFELFADSDHFKLNGLLQRNRYRSEVFLIHYCDSGNSWKGSLYFAPEIFGGGGVYEHPDSRGATFFVLEYHRPNWDFIETIIDHGSRDMVGIAREHIFLPRLQAHVGFSLNRYNLKGFSDAARSYAFEGELTYAFRTERWLGNESSLSINYSVDAEYETHLRKKEDDLALLPLSNREDHAVTLFTGKRYHRNLALEGYGGYLYDRVVGGKLVPVYGGTVTVGREGCLEGRFLYSHSTSTESSGEDVDRFVLDVKYVY